MNKLMEFRIRAGLSRGQLARKIGRSRQTVKGLEEDPKWMPNLDTAYAIAAAVDATVEEIWPPEQPPAA